MTSTSKNTGKKIFSGGIWASIDKFVSLFLQFLVNLILARLVSPSDYGCVGMLAIFLTVSQVMIDGGFGSALIQKKEPTQTDYSTIFYWNIIFSSILYLILYVSSPAIASFYNMPILNDVLRVIGLNLIINSFGIIQINRQRKQLAFKKIALINISSYVIAAIIAVYMAYHGYGVWSLVMLQILYSLISVLLFWIFTKWTPDICFSMASLKKLFSFGSYILFSNLLQETCKNLQGLIIGKKFSSFELGLYSQAKRLDDITSLTLPNIIVQVMFPVFSQYQNDIDYTKKVLRMNVRIISFITFPIMILLILIADPLINFLYGEKWIKAIPYFQILCVGGLFACLQNINYYVVAAQGKSKTLFRWSLYKWGILFILLITGMQWGMTGILWGMVISSLNIYVVNAVLVSICSPYSILSQMKDIYPILIVSILPCVICMIINEYIIMHFIFQIILYGLIYIGLSFALKLQAKDECLALLKKIRQK